MSQRTEQEIMRNWKYMDPPLVSVCCITYNHEPYIRDAIEGFLMQETDFPFEVIIHDDASTDKTAEIVREYAEQYPQIIKPIFQTENQYSKGVGVSATYVWPRVQGEYIALCEGDDYWIKNDKLQKQIDYLQAHEECSMCLHTAEKLSPDKSIKLGFLGLPGAGSRQYKLQDIGDKFFATASYVFRKKIVDNLPHCYKISKTAGDFILFLLLLDLGYCFYFDEVMSVYRVQVPGGMNDRLKQARKNKKQIRDYYFNRQKVLMAFNKHTEYRHNSFIKNYKLNNHVRLVVQMAIIEKNFFKKNKYLHAILNYFCELFSFIEKLKLLIKIYMPARINNLLKLVRDEIFFR
jgi:glycosyltransferase involved in cell wall biosynthesis